MRAFTDMFTAPDSAAEKKAQAETDEKIRLTGDIARVCLSMDQFKVYRKQYAAAEEKMIDEMMMTTACFSSGSIDLTQYGAKMLVCITRLKDLRMLLDTVESNARKSANG
jgi:hypothetical protein